MLPSGDTISLIMPARNESENIDVMLALVPDWYDEVIVVDNNSDDGFFEKMLALEDSRIRVLSCKEVDSVGCGYGASILVGLRAATSDWLVTADFDGTYPVNVADRIVRSCVRNNAPAAICVRYPDAAIPPMLQTGVKVLNVEYRILHGWHCRDSLSGMFVVSRQAFLLMDGDSSIDWSVGWDFSPQFKIELLRHYGKDGVLQRKVKQNHRGGGDTKQNYWRTGFGHLFWIAKDRFKRGKVVV